MPTGGGKSITFQVPALTQDGVCIVVTPLISLMKDQVMHLKQMGLRAEAIYAGIHRKEIIKILDNAIFGAVKFLYVSPERLGNELFLAKLAYMKVCFITVDEAHCISQWGYDFRPSYLEINKMRALLEGVPVLALTATATPKVVDDIIRNLEFGKHTTADDTSLTSAGTADTSLTSAREYTPHVFSMSFKRANISYVVRHTEDKERELVHILTSVKGCAIVYTRNRQKTKDISRMLNEHGISATYYHAGLDIAIKDQRQQQWHDGQVRVIVATNAFGMGIDKPDVRLVIHIDCPDSLEAYYQEAGRAGRDGQRSYAVLLYAKSDRHAWNRHLGMVFPSREYIRRVYDHLCFFFYVGIDSGAGAQLDFDMNRFCTVYKHYPAILEGALNILHHADYIYYNPDGENRARVKIKVPSYELYTFSSITPHEEEVLTAMLRMYGTLFTDLTFIDFNMLCSKCRIDDQRLHLTLKELARKGVIVYVPRRDIPSITFLRDRVESSRLIIPRAIYEDLHDMYIERAKKMFEYAEQGYGDDCMLHSSKATCRQRLLLDYFGETLEEDCGSCDVCIERKKEAATEQNLQSTEQSQQSPERSQQQGGGVLTPLQAVMQLLSDGKEHNITEIRQLDYPMPRLTEAIDMLRNQDRLIINGSSIKLTLD